jgi:hypothetical protein
MYKLEMNKQQAYTYSGMSPLCGKHFFFFLRVVDRVPIYASRQFWLRCFEVLLSLEESAVEDLKIGKNHSLLVLSNLVVINQPTIWPTYSELITI